LCLIVVAILGPLCLMKLCVWVRSPSRSQKMQTAWFGDSMLQELLDGRNFLEHVTIYGAEHADRGTIVMLPGVSAARGTLAPLASLVGEHFRVICVDLPGQGTLSAVPYSLARCETVLTLVTRRAHLDRPGQRVVLAAYGAATYVAAHFSLRAASQHSVAGLVFMGSVPDYIGRRSCNLSMDDMFRMQWVSVFANRALKAKIASSDWPAHLRRVAGQSDFNLAVISDVRAELFRRPLLRGLIAFPRTIIFLGPRSWVEEAEELVPVHRVRTRRVRGARDDKLPPVDALGLATMASELVEVSCARSCWTG
jgi:pimeloyl-ACP methyl ester carboxylesterase